MTTTKATTREHACLVTHAEVMASIERLRVASQELKQHERLKVQEHIEETRWLAEKLAQAPCREEHEATEAMVDAVTAFTCTESEIMFTPYPGTSKHIYRVMEHARVAAKGDDDE